MYNRSLLIILFFGFLVLLVACGGPPGPVCDPTSLAAPVIAYPGSFQVVALDPTAAWTYSPMAVYPYPYPDPACLPDQFHIMIAPGPAYEPVVWEGTVPGTDTTWAVTPDLEPGGVYAMWVEGIMDGVAGPQSMVRKFFTGPQCTEADLVAPVQISPADGAVVTGEYADLMFDNPAPCLVDGYHFRMTHDGWLIIDQTYFVPLQRLLIFDDYIEPCETYQWQVAAVLGDESDYVETDFSPNWSFTFNPFGACPLPPVENSITGKVFHDLCALPELGPLPSPLPVGCVPDGGGSARADGIYTYGEPGIEGVQVGIAEGPCASAVGGPAMLTDSFGNFQFTGLTPGTYCIVVEALNATNTAILIPGGWTLPASAIGDDVARYEVVLGASEAVTGVNFGWDYQFLPAWGDLASISGTIWEDKCAYSEIGPIPDPLPDGCVLKDGIVQGDAIRDPGEPGIPGLVVDLGLGDCPSSGLRTTLTDVEGYYSFENLPPGKYCVRVNAEDATNAAILLPGRWTLVSSGHMGMTFRALTLTAGEEQILQDFAWDYRLPFYFGRLPLLRFKLPTACRLGPSNDYRVVAYLEEDWVLPIVGRTEDGSWVNVLLTEDPLTLGEDKLDPLTSPFDPWDLRDQPFSFEEKPGHPPEPGLEQFPNVFLPEGKFSRCWVYVGVGQTINDLRPVPLVQYPDLFIPEPEPEVTPTVPPPVVCSTYLTQSTCISAGCIWHPYYTRVGGYCSDQ